MRIYNIPLSVYLYSNLDVFIAWFLDKFIFGRTNIKRMNAVPEKAIIGQETKLTLCKVGGLIILLKHFSFSLVLHLSQFINSIYLLFFFCFSSDHMSHEDRGQVYFIPHCI